LWSWRNAAYNYRVQGIRVPCGTTNVEGGFHALRQAMRLLHGSYTQARFMSLCRVAIMSLNFYILHKRSMPTAFQRDAQSFHLVQGVMCALMAKSAPAAQNSADARAFLHWIRSSERHDVNFSGGAGANRFAQADGFGVGPRLATISDPFGAAFDAAGDWLPAAFFGSLRDSILARAAELHIALAADGSDVCQHSAVMNVLYDVDLIWLGMETHDEMSSFLDKFFQDLFSPEKLRMKLPTLYQEHGHHDVSSMGPRCFAASHQFVGDSFAVHPHYAAAPFLDHLLSLTPVGLMIEDGAMHTRVSRATVLLAYTGMGKSPLLKFAYEASQSTTVQQTFASSPSPSIKKCETFSNVVTTSINLNFLLKTAEKFNDPSGLRIVVEELSHLMNKSNGKLDKAKLDPVDFITVIDPTFVSGKKTASNKVTVPDLRCVVTAGCQPNKIHEFFPHSLEGESFRVEFVGTPAHKSTENDNRSNKTVSKKGVAGFWSAVYATAVKSILPLSEGALKLDPKTRKMIELLEGRSKSALRQYKEQHGEIAEADPFYYYLNGKLDGKMMNLVAECFLQRVLLLKLIFPQFPVQMVTHEIDGRTAMRRCLFQILERRGMVNHVLQSLHANKRLWSTVFGEMTVPLCVSEASASSRRPAAAPTAEETEQDRLNKILAALFESRDPCNVLYPQHAQTMLNRQLGAKTCPTLITLMQYYKLLSETYRVVTAVGAASRDGLEVTWRSIALGEEIKEVRRSAATGGKGKGGGGGRAMVPIIRLLEAHSLISEAFLSEVTGAVVAEPQDFGEGAMLASRADLLVTMEGDRHGAVAEEVHAYAVLLATRNKIEPTSQAQRQRSLPRLPVTTPEAYAPLAASGYISPLYGWSPEGHVWVTIPATGEQCLRACTPENV
jgi:hypothetical protein